MVECGRRLWQRNLIGACEGNLSCQLDDGRILCTPNGAVKGDLGASDLVVIDLNGKQIDSNSNTPSSEIRVHTAIYRECPSVGAVVHAHPIYATSFALAGVTIPTDSLPEALVELGPVALVPFAMPGTEELPAAMLPYLDKHRTFLLANHGAVTVGSGLLEAANRMECLERVAQIIYLSRALGGPVPLGEDDLRRLGGTR
ncbi:MAG: class II aldolase/adducin family protein [Fimbriimonadaceae bacterium]